MPCLPVVQENIRAEVYLGGVLLAKTPYIKSFNVSKSRGQVSNTFNITLELLGSTSFNSLGGNLSIRAGLKGDLKDIFTGVIESNQVRPAFGKPSYYSITLAGRGILSELENKTFSRRLKTDGQGLFCLITSGPSNRPASLKSLDKTVKAGNQDQLASSPNPAGTGEQSPLVVFNSAGEKVGNHGGGLLGSIAGKPSGAGTPGDGFRTHTHESLDEGGPAYGVFSSD